MPNEWGYNLGFNNKILTAIDNTKVAESHGFPRITQKAIPQAIFLSNNNYFTHNKKDLIPEWTIVFEGHGAAGKKICELTIPEFQEILNFAENHITTRLLCYITCFSGGLSEQQTYQGAKSSWLSKTYAYPILVAGWGDELVGKALSSYTPFFSEAFKLTWDIEKLFNTLDVRRDTDNTIPTKIFLIDEMTFVDPDSNKKDPVPVTINQILISQNDCYYQYQGELYTQTADKKSTEKASEEYAEKYRSLWQQYYQQITDHREGKGGQLHNAMHKISATLEKKLPNISAKT